MRISDWSSDVCSSDLIGLHPIVGVPRWLAGIAQLEDVGDIAGHRRAIGAGGTIEGAAINAVATIADRLEIEPAIERAAREPEPVSDLPFEIRSEEHTSELQSLMRISYAVFCLKKKTRK